MILFGSYARGDWVEDPDNHYFSDYDLLVLAAKREIKKAERWAICPDHRRIKEESELPPLPEDWDDQKAIIWWGQMVRSEGVSEGEAKGEVRGREAERLSIALSLLAEGMDKEQVARLTGLTPEEVAALGQEM